MEKKSRGMVLSHDGGSISEQDLADRVPISGVSFQQALEALGLTEEELLGLRVLDIGAGTSTFLKRLLDLQVDAYAIDPAYKSRSDLKGKVKAYITGHDHFSKPEKQKRLTELEEFMESMKDHPERYLRALAGSIPFPDDSFDKVVSLSAISGYLNADMPIYLQAVDECIRVTKPGGQIILSPFSMDTNRFPQEVNALRRVNDMRLIGVLGVNPQVASALAQPLQTHAYARRLVISLREPH